MRPDKIKGLSIVLVRVEAIVQEHAQEAAALRDAEDVRGAPTNRKVGAIAKGGRRVPNRRQADTSDTRAGRSKRSPNL